MSGNQRPSQHPGSPSSYKEFVPASQQPAQPTPPAPMENPYSQNAIYYYHQYHEDEPLRHPDDFPSSVAFAVYWDSLPKHVRHYMTQTDTYDRFITELYNYDADQLEYDEVDPVRPTIVRGMYFNELADLVFNMFKEQKEAEEKAEKEKAEAGKAKEKVGKEKAGVVAKGAVMGGVSTKSAAVPVVPPSGTVTGGVPAKSAAVPVVPPSGTVPA